MTTGTYQRLAILDATSGLHLNTYDTFTQLAESAIRGIGREIPKHADQILWLRGILDRLEAEAEESRLYHARRETWQTAATARLKERWGYGEPEAVQTARELWADSPDEDVNAEDFVDEEMSQR